MLNRMFIDALLRGNEIKLKRDNQKCLTCGKHMPPGRAGRSCKECREKTGKWVVVIRFSDSGAVHDVVSGFKTEHEAIDWCGVFQAPTDHRFMFLVIHPTCVSDIKLVEE